MYHFISHVTSESRQTARSALPSPSKSAAAGMSSGIPNLATIGAFGLRLGSTYQVALPGRQTARSAFPSPSKSAATGTSPGIPQILAMVFPVLLKAMYQVPLGGRQTAKSALPSPSKSAAIGMSLSAPHLFVIGRSGWLLGAIYQVPTQG